MMTRRTPKRRVVPRQGEAGIKRDNQNQLATTGLAVQFFAALRSRWNDQCSLIRVRKIEPEDEIMKLFRRHRTVAPGELFLLALLAIVSPRMAQADESVFTDTLQNGWENWSWAANNFNNPAPVHAGTRSISVTAGPWEALYFHHSSLNPGPFTNLTFWIHGGTAGGQRLRVKAMLGTTLFDPGQAIGPLPANTWQQINVPMPALVPSGQASIDGIWFQENTGSSAPTFYVDDVSLSAGATPPPPANPIVIIRVDAAASRRAINPEVYGVAFASTAELSALNAPLNRSGGNATTRYNWQINASSRAQDWYFESIGSANTAQGGDGDDFVSQTKAAGAEPMLTIPTMGWVAKLGPGRSKLASFSIAKYGAQTGSDSQWFPDAGNGVSQSTGNEITGNDPNDANQPADSAFQAGWVRHLTNRWGSATIGGLRYYLLDNEPGIWHSTHRDVHPTGATMEEIRDRMIDHATRIKSVDPDAVVVGPEEWGWSGYLYSGFDLQYGSVHGWSSLPDRAAHGGRDFLPWLLDQLRRTNNATGTRLLDVFTVHYYPQGGEYGSDVSTAMQLRRNRSTRSLWDTNYLDETWINDKVMLAPRLRNWVTANYPGTRIGLTEYSWGADNHINGATAQADVLGILGREGIDLATRWTTPSAGSPAFKAIQLYRNYDGARSTFGDISVSAAVPNPDNLAAFAATRSSDGALTIIAINKVLTGSTPVLLSVTNHSATGSARVWQLTSANAISRQPDAVITGGLLSNTLPAQSITLFVLPAAAIAPGLRASTGQSANQVQLWLDGQAGRRYVVESATTPTAWAGFSTNTLASNSLSFLIPSTNGPMRLFRALASPP